MEFYSHLAPDKKLIDHLIEVAELSKSYGDSRFAEVHRLIGIAHDFGKYTSYFQDRLFGRKNWGEKAHHAYISAVFGAYLCRAKLGEEASLLPLWAFSAILSHHDDIKEFYSSYYLIPTINWSMNRRWLDDKIQTIQEQLHNISNNLTYIKIDFERIGLTDLACSFVQDNHTVIETLEYLKELTLYMEDNPDENNYWMHQLFYSCLIAADKISAGRINPVNKLSAPINVLLNQKENITSERKHDRIAPIRREIFQEVQNNLIENYNQSKIFSITAPTGTGKTLTGFFAAKKLQELLGNKHKIIYALPFTSIIEQNYNVICSLHSIEDEFKEDISRYVIKHHHLSNTEYISKDEDYRKEQAELLIENWDSGIIVTTFVQLLETIIGDRNRMLKKFHVLTNSIILLDEVQAIPLEYYKLVDYVFSKLTEIFDCRIILMTATKPMIFNKTQELIRDPDYYFSLLKRTCIYPEMNKISVNAFCDKFINNMDKNKSYLIVANTINQSLEIFVELSKTIPSEKLYYLSTNLLPIHRKEILSKLSKIMRDKKEKIILVSTQVVEAGVDLDFDEVYRDIAPLDSIIQCAGRCNRNYSLELGRVNVVYMVNDRGKSFGQKVYKNVVIKIVEDLLNCVDKIDESQYNHLIAQYYNIVCNGKISMQESYNLINAMINMNFNKETGVGTFSLIDEKDAFIELFVEFDDYASMLLYQLESAVNLPDVKERWKQIKEIRKNMLQYTISVPIKFALRYSKRNFGNMELLVMDKDNVPLHYDIKTGLKRNEEFDMICF